MYGSKYSIIYSSTRSNNTYDPNWVLESVSYKMLLEFSSSRLLYSAENLGLDLL